MSTPRTHMFCIQSLRTKPSLLQGTLQTMWFKTWGTCHILLEQQIEIILKSVFLRHTQKIFEEDAIYYAGEVAMNL